MLMAGSGRCNGGNVDVFVCCFNFFNEIEAWTLTQIKDKAEEIGHSKEKVEL